VHKFLPSEGFKADSSSSGTPVISSSQSVVPKTPDLHELSPFAEKNPVPDELQGNRTGRSRTPSPRFGGEYQEQLEIENRKRDY
jgi:hypothetical protein